MRNYNEEIKVMADLEYRYAIIDCEGSYGVNPEVTMLTGKSTIYNGFIKEVQIKYLGEDENGEKQYEKTLIIDSEYGHEIKLPYEKVLYIEVISSKEQAELERYNRKKKMWEEQIIHYKNLLKDETNEEWVKHINEIIEITKSTLKRGEELVEKGVKTFK